jgi:hypothetical protein
LERILRFSDLSPARQTLIRTCQWVNFGEIRNLVVNDSEPEPGSSTILIDEKLDVADGPRKERELSDFPLCGEMKRLMCRLDEIRNGRIERIEVHAGVPRRVRFEVAIKSESR